MLGSIARRSVVLSSRRFRYENPGATQPQKSQPRDVEYFRAHADAHRIGIASHPGRVN
jgi:hypothetical protein